jgi:hypothetical protein
MSLKQLKEEEEILDWVENLEIKKKPDEKKSFLKRWWEDFIFDIKYWWYNSIILPIKEFFQGINNFIRWRKIIWKDRWWDYAYLLEMLHFKLKDMEEHWGKDTHYVNDYKDKEILVKLIEDLEWLLDDSLAFEDGYNEEYQKRSKRFFEKLGRHHRKFWD